MPWNPQYMRGVEINCAEIDIDKAEQVKAFAKAHNLLVTCGTDYHGVARACKGGIALPESCQTAADVAKYMKENELLVLQEWL